MKECEMTAKSKNNKPQLKNITTWFFKVHHANQPIFSKTLLVRWVEIIRAKYSHHILLSLRSCLGDLTSFTVNSLSSSDVLGLKHSTVWTSHISFPLQQISCSSESNIWVLLAIHRKVFDYHSYLLAIFYRTLCSVFACLFVLLGFFFLFLSEHSDIIWLKTFGKFES